MIQDLFKISEVLIQSNYRKKDEVILWYVPFSGSFLFKFEFVLYSINNSMQNYGAVFTYLCYFFNFSYYKLLNIQKLKVFILFFRKKETEEKWNYILSLLEAYDEKFAKLREIITTIEETDSILEEMQQLQVNIFHFIMRICINLNKVTFRDQ